MRLLALDHFGDFEEAAVGFGGFGHDGGAVDRGTDGVGAECLAGGGGWDAENFGDLRHGRDVGGVELVEFSNVAEDGVEIARHVGELFWGELEVGEVSYVADFFEVDAGGCLFHIFFVPFTSKCIPVRRTEAIRARSFWSAVRICRKGGIHS